MKRSLAFLALLNFSESFAQLTCTYDSLTQTETCLYPNGKVSSVRQWKQLGRANDYHMVNYSYWGGYKTSEYSERYGMRYDTSRYWNWNGSLGTLEIYSDSGYVSLIFDSSGTIRDRSEYSIPKQIRNSVHFLDSASGFTFDSKPYEYGEYVPTGIWNTFHANGKLESTGRNLPYTFTGAKSYIDTSHSDCRPAGMLVVMMNEKTIIRDGTWHYYDETGKEIREEYYEGGLLRSTIEY